MGARPRDDDYGAEVEEEAVVGGYGNQAQIGGERVAEVGVGLGAEKMEAEEEEDDENDKTGMSYRRADGVLIQRALPGYEA